jgi:hypothetical protein
MWMRLLTAIVLALLTGCRPAKETTEAELKSWRLLEGSWAAVWKPAGIPDQGTIELNDGILMLNAGAPLTGTVFPAWQSSEFPVTHYAVEYEALRVEGEDSFGMLTFPVGSHDAHATFVLGGWGGTVTGISSIDYADANENSTRGEQRFENQRWYHVRLEVRPEDLRVWVEGRPVVNVSIKGRNISLRPGFIDHCRPFGFASYATTARLRNVVVQRLKEGSR